MATTRVNLQHDYVTLKVEFTKGTIRQRINLTISHNGTKGSSNINAEVMDKPTFKRIFKAWDAATWTDKTVITGNVGERVAKLAKVAEAARDPAHLADLFEAAIKGERPMPSITVAAPKDPRYGKPVTRPITVLKDHAPLAGEGSGKFIQRLWMAGHNDPDALVALVRRHYAGRTTSRSDVAYNVNQLRKQHGADQVPAWPKRGG